MFWDSPFPATLQDAQFRLVDVNEAFVQFTGYRREQLIGRDPVELAARGGSRAVAGVARALARTAARSRR